MNKRFPSLIILGVIVAVLATVLNKWVFGAILLFGGAALAVVVWKLVSRGQFVPPTILIDEAKARFAGDQTIDTEPNPVPDAKEPDGSDRTTQR